MIRADLRTQRPSAARKGKEMDFFRALPEQKQACGDCDLSRVKWASRMYQNPAVLF